MRIQFYKTLSWAFLALFIFLYPTTSTQANHGDEDQTIRGQVLDLNSQAPITDAILEILNSSPRITARTDENGKFRMEDVPLGRHKVLISKDGYTELVINGLNVTAGKEVVIVVKLEEDLKAKSSEGSIAENPKTRNRTRPTIIRSAKDAANNEFAITTVRLFSSEEVGRFAGDRQDPSRLVANYGGMFNMSDYDNHLVVRGNSPSTFQWKIEGVPAQNLNHLAQFGTTGGRFNILNINTIDNSDLYLGSFAAEYNNSIGSIFDINLHKGNEEQFHGILQISGATGLQGMLEGPLSKKGDGSFMLAVRYGTFNYVGWLSEKLSNHPSTPASAAPNLWDYTAKINFPKTKAGKFSFFGVGGRSNDFLDGTNQELAEAAQEIHLYEKAARNTSIGIVGLNHRIAIGRHQQGYFHTTLGTTLWQSRASKSLTLPGDPEQILFDNINTRFTLYAKTTFTQKVNRKFSFRTGLSAESFKIELDQLREIGTTNVHKDTTIIGSALSQIFFQTLWRPLQKLQISMGLNSQLLTLNNSLAIEPRLGLRWFIANRHSVFASFGVHSQTLPWEFYAFQEENSNNQMVQPYLDYGFMAANHYHYGYEWVISDQWRLKLDVFSRNLSKIPTDTSNSFISLVNYGGVDPYPINNNMAPIGGGSASGGEITLEKFFDRGYYIVSNFSYFQSTYYRDDIPWADQQPLPRTAFGNGIGSRLAIGKEFYIGERKVNRLTIDFKAAYNNAGQTFPIDLPASIAANTTIYDVSNGTSQNMKDYFRLDLKIGFIVNGKKGRVSHWYFFDFLNILNTQNERGFYYNAMTQSVSPILQRPFSLDFFYQFRF